jgi:aspartate aminotransferase-like enzyme
MSVPEQLLLGPGPRPVSSRVMQALALPVISHFRVLRGAGHRSGLESATLAVAERVLAAV